MFFKTLRIFLGLKWEEIKEPFVTLYKGTIEGWRPIVIVIGMIMYLTIAMVGSVSYPWMKWLILGPTLVIIALVMVLLAWIFVDWLRSNWREAKRRSAPPSASEEE